MAYWYVSSAGYATVATWQASHAYGIGNIIRPPSPVSGQECCYVCVTAGTTAASQPTWSNSKGASIHTGTAFFREATGYPALNGDSANTIGWAPSTHRAVGDIIKNLSGGPDTYFICTTSGKSKSGTEPAWNKTGGATTTDGTAVWTSLGPISNYSAIWAAPQTSLFNVQQSGATGWGHDGDTFFISDSHSDSFPNSSPLALGIISAPCRYLCVDDSAAPPTTLADTAVINMSVTQNVADDGGGQVRASYAYGLNFSSFAFIINGTSLVFDHCSFALNDPFADQRFQIGQYGATSARGNFDFIDCEWTFHDATHRIAFLNAPAINMLRNAFALTGSVPQVLFDLAATANGFSTGANHVTVRDCDMSTVNTTLVNLGCFSETSLNTLDISNCRLNAGVTLTAVSSGAIDSPASRFVRIFNCDSGATNNTMLTQNYMGATQQSASIIRSGGASTGASGFSWKMVTTANSSYANPLESEPIAIWNEVVGSSLAATIEIAGAAALNTDEIWVEFEYLGNASYPLGSTASTRATILDTGTGVPSSTATWSGSPSSTQKLTASFTPQMKGIIKARVYLAKPGTTAYIDPYIGLSNNVSNRRQYILPGFGGMNETAQGEFSYTFIG